MRLVEARCGAATDDRLADLRRRPRRSTARLRSAIRSRPRRLTQAQAGLTQHLRLLKARPRPQSARGARGRDSGQADGTNKPREQTIDTQIQLISDGDGLAILGDASAV